MCFMSLSRRIHYRAIQVKPFRQRFSSGLAFCLLNSELLSLSSKQHSQDSITPLPRQTIEHTDIKSALTASRGRELEIGHFFGKERTSDTTYRHPLRHQFHRRVTFTTFGQISLPPSC